jgi:hypothetical protein
MKPVESSGVTILSDRGVKPRVDKELPGVLV